jgi:hypothetical protein
MKAIDLTNFSVSEIVICSLSAVDNAMIVCIFDCQYSGTPARSTMKHIWDLAVSESEMTSLVNQLPVKSSST